MNTCDTCKWWGNKKEAYSDTGSDNIKPCGSPCIDTDYTGEDCAEVENNGHQDERSFFITGPKFGCVHHESK